MLKLIVILLLCIIAATIGNFWSVSYRDRGRKVALQRTILFVLSLVLFSFILYQII